ncbi:MAG: YbbR-like domain-containing protein [Winogradskyella sp.]
MKKESSISEFLKKRNAKRFSIFLAIAFVFLVFSKLSTDYKQKIKLEPNLINYEDEVMLLNDSLNEIEAFVEAKGFSLIPFLFKDSKTIVLDANEDVVSRPDHFIFDVQKHKYLIEAQLGQSYNVLSLKPDTLIISYSKRASKYVPIELNTDISFSSGYDTFKSIQLNVDSVKVVGAMSYISKITSISSEQFRKQDVNNNIDEDIKLVKPTDVEIFPDVVNIKAEVKRFTEGKIEVPVSVINKPNDISLNFFPKTIVVSYYVDLDNYKKIDKTSFVVECDYNEAIDNQSYMISKIVNKPEFVKRVIIKQNRIDYIKL